MRRPYLMRQIDWIQLNDRSYEFLFDKLGTDEVVSIDCETTGLNPKKDDVVSIAAIMIRGKRIMTSEAFQIRVNPEANLAANSIKIHQIRKKDVEDERPIRKILPDLLKFIGNRPLVGYYIDFDVRMLNKDIFMMLNICLQNPLIDVCDIYYDRKYGNAPPGTLLDLRFASIMEDLQLPPLQVHDAFNDALLAAEMYLHLRDLQTKNTRIKRSREWELPPQSPLG